LSFKVVSLFLVFLLAFFPLSVKASSVQIVTVSADTYVDSYNFDDNFGQEPYLMVADTFESAAYAFLMFNLSRVSQYYFNASSEVELRLYCHNVTFPFIVGVHRCFNNTWSEDTLAFDSITNLSHTNSSESAVIVSSNNTWYEWTVTDFVGSAMQPPASPDRVTLVLEPGNNSEGNYTAFFYSTHQSSTQYYPQLVFSYRSMMDPVYTYLEVGSGFVVFTGIVIVAYRFSGKKKRKRFVRKTLSRQGSTRSVDKSL
jgi:hypothetical protein